MGGITRSERIAAARAALAERYAADPAGVARFNARMAHLAAARKREQQRIDHLVLGQKRPVERVTEGKRRGRTRPKMVERPVVLEPGIEEAMQVRESWSHKAYGTPETWERALNTHDGALAQLHRNGTIDKDQLEWAAQIANVYRSLESDVGVKVASLEARVDQSRSGGQAIEGVYRARMHLAYGYWRARLPAPKQLVLDMVVGDAVGYSVAARVHRVHKRKAKRFLLDALNSWPACVAHAFSVVDHDMVAALNIGMAIDPVWLDGPRRAPVLHIVPSTPSQTAAAEVACPAPLPPIDPVFLDDAGNLKEWEDIAAIVRARAFGIEDEAA